LSDQGYYCWAASCGGGGDRSNDFGLKGGRGGESLTEKAGGKGVGRDLGAALRFAFPKNLRREILTQARKGMLHTARENACRVYRRE